jgi:type I restriction enzyme, S subunit
MKITDDFGLFATAPGGIAALRRLILQLAVQGKLVPQDPNDEPAQKLLERIWLEKSLFTSEYESQIPIAIPETWIWTSIDQLGSVMGGLTKNSRRDSLPLRFPYLRVANVHANELRLNEIAEIGVTESEISRTLLQEKDLLIVEGNGSLDQVGRVALWNGAISPCLHQNHIIKIRFFEIEMSKFVLYSLLSPYGRKQITHQAITTSGLYTLSLSKVSKLLIPLPPLQEQARIVTMIETLMAQCDALEAAQRTQEAHRAAFASAALTAVGNSDYEAWHTVRDHFPLVAATPADVKKLRETILQLAVRGKLVAQEPTDEPAAILLGQIRTEKARLVREGKLKAEKPLPPISEDEIPYELPEGWEWVRLEDVSTQIHYGYTASADPNLSTVRLLRITDIQDNKVNWESVPGCSIEVSQLNTYQLNEGDIVIARTGGTIGKSYLVSGLNVVSVFASYLIRVIPVGLLLPQFIKRFLETPLYWEQLWAKSMGTGQPNVNGTSLKSLILPLPPLAEQARIVARVETLLAQCDTLEVALTERSATQAALVKAVVETTLVRNNNSDKMKTGERLWKVS